MYVPPKGGLKSGFDAGFSHKSHPEIAWNSCSRQVYLITLDARSIIYAITHIFIQFPFSRSEICRITPSRFPLGGPLNLKSPTILSARATKRCESRFVLRISLNFRQILASISKLNMFLWKHHVLLRNYINYHNVRTILMSGNALLSKKEIDWNSML